VGPVNHLDGILQIFVLQWYLFIRIQLHLLVQHRFNKQPALWVEAVILESGPNLRTTVPRLIETRVTNQLVVLVYQVVKTRQRRELGPKLVV
jgi:hypothetical protein